MEIKVFTVDSFTSKIFRGNPAAVMPLDKKISDELMQNIAAEINLSETSFLQIADDESRWKTSQKFALRWMTPTKEVNLCGHATLAAAHVLYREYDNVNDLLEFQTLSGSLFTKKQDDEIIMNFPQGPLRPLTSSESEICEPLIKQIAQDKKVKEVVIGTGPFNNLLIRLDDQYTRTEFDNHAPSIKHLTSLHDGSFVNGIMLTLKGELQDKTFSRGIPEYNFLSRYFASWFGIDEDPVTGSSHSYLGPYWAEKLNTKDLLCRQSSKRGGDLRLIIESNDRLSIAGKAITVMEGKFRI